MAILAMRGPRDVYGELYSGGGGTSFADAAVGKTVLAMTGALGGVTGMFTAGMVRARLRRLRDFPPSKAMRPYSATRARLVLTPFCCSSSAITE